MKRWIHASDNDYDALYDDMENALINLAEPAKFHVKSTGINGLYKDTIDLRVEHLSDDTYECILYINDGRKGSFSAVADTFDDVIKVFYPLLTKYLNYTLRFKHLDLSDRDLHDMMYT